MGNISRGVSTTLLIEAGMLLQQCRDATIHTMSNASKVEDYRVQGQHHSCNGVHRNNQRGYATVTIATTGLDYS